MRRLFNGFAAGAVVATTLMAGAISAHAQEVTLRLHQFLPPQSTVPAQLLTPWAEKIERESDGRIRIELFHAMALGGRPPELISQVRDGAVDIVFTLPGYTPGLFPRVELVELPFMGTDAETTSRAYWDLYDTEMRNTDYKDFHVLATWVHGPGVLHTKGDAIKSLDDMKGKKLRGPTRIINSMIDKLGGVPVGMPVPAIPEALSKGVIDGTMIPWEVTSALRVAELTDAHTEFSGDRMIYTAAFVLAMNKQSYAGLPDDLKAILDANSGAELSAMFGRIQQEADIAARKIAQDRGNEFVTVEGDALNAWREAAQPVYNDWIAEMDSKGADGTALVEKARGLVEKYAAEKAEQQ